MTKLPIPVYGTSVLVLPASALTMNPPDGAYLRVLLALCAQNRTADSAEALAKVLSLPLDTVKNALSYWSEGGVLTYTEHAQTQAAVISGGTSESEQKPKPMRDTFPKYSEEELAQIYQSNLSLRPAIDACQNELGKIFSTHEAAKMAALYHDYGLDEAYLITLCAMCKKRNKQSVSYVVKTALELYDDGIRTAGALDAHMKAQDARQTVGAKLHKLFGLGEREEGRTEKVYFDRWTITWQFPYEIICAAFDIATKQTGKAGLAYINKILSEWNNNGIRTLEAVEAAQVEYKKNKMGKPKTASGENMAGEAHSYALDEFVDLAMKRSFQPK